MRGTCIKCGNKAISKLSYLCEHHFEEQLEKSDKAS